MSIFDSQSKTVHLIAACGFLALAASAHAGGKSEMEAQLSGDQEVPPVSTSGAGALRANLSDDKLAIEYELSYGDLTEDVVSASHIHFGVPGVNGGVSAFLCGGGGKPPCPASPKAPSSPAIVKGSIVAGDVVGPAGQGIAAGDFAKLLSAVAKGLAYVNVHTPKFGGGEIRGAIVTSPNLSRPKCCANAALFCGGSVPPQTKCFGIFPNLIPCGWCSN